MAKREKRQHQKFIKRPGVKPARLMSIFNDLPRHWKFEFDPYFGIYMPGLHISTEVCLKGGGTFLFEQSEDPVVVNLTVTDVHFYLAPFILPFDIDGDGTYESIEIGSALIGPECLDKKKSKGHINLATGEIKIHWALDVKPGPGLLPELTLLLKKIDKKSFKFKVDDYGTVNFDDGTYSLHGGFFALDESVFPGVMIRGSGDSKLCGGNKLWLYGSIIPPATTCLGYPLPDYTKELVICPDDTILLCWESGNVYDLMLNPGKKKGLSDQGHMTVVPGKSKQSLMIYDMSAKYTTCSDTESTISDYVMVNIFEGGWLPITTGSYHAKPDPNFGGWTCIINENYNSSNIMVEKIQFILGEGCLNAATFDVDREPLSDMYRSIGNMYTPVEGYEEADLPYMTPLPGRWTVFPRDSQGKRLDPHDYNKMICFRLKGKCTKK